MSLCPFIPVSSSSSCFSQGLLLIISKALLPRLPCVITLYSTNKVQVPIRHPRDDYSICVSGPNVAHITAAFKCCITTLYTHLHGFPCKSCCYSHFTVRRTHDHAFGQLGILWQNWELQITNTEVAVSSSQTGFS